MSYECVILFRNPSSGKIGFIAEDDGDIAVFKDREDAIACKAPILSAFPSQIVEVDEL